MKFFRKKLWNASEWLQLTAELYPIMVFKGNISDSLPGSFVNYFIGYWALAPLTFPMKGLSWIIKVILRHP